MSPILNLTRRVIPPAVRIQREDGIFLVVYRSHGWLHTNLGAALEEAEELAAGHGCKVIPRIVPRWS